MVIGTVFEYPIIKLIDLKSEGLDIDSSDSSDSRDSSVSSASNDSCD